MKDSTDTKSFIPPQLKRYRAIMSVLKRISKKTECYSISKFQCLADLQEYVYDIDDSFEGKCVRHTTLLEAKHLQRDVENS